MKPWPWPKASQGLYRQTRAMLDASAGLSITGWEVSCKFSPRGLETGRWLLGFSPVGVAAKRLHELPHRLGMPSGAAADFGLRLASSSQVLLAVEQGAQQTVSKAYLEFPVNQRAATPLHLIGYKWPIPQTACADSAPPARLTHYRWPGDHDQARSLLMQAAGREAGGLTQASACALLAQALQWTQGQKPGQRPALLLAVSEAGSPRASWTATFYDSPLRAADLRSGVTRLAAAWGLSDGDVQAVLDVIGSREIGWLAAGTGSEGLPFFTLYAAADRDDAHQALSACTEVPRHALHRTSWVAGAST